MSNMAIIQTLNGSVDAYTSSAAHLIFDVSGSMRALTLGFGMQVHDSALCWIIHGE